MPRIGDTERARLSLSISRWMRADCLSISSLAESIVSPSAIVTDLGLSGLKHSTDMQAYHSDIQKSIILSTNTAQTCRPITLMERVHRLH